MKKASEKEIDGCGGLLRLIVTVGPTKVEHKLDPGRISRVEGDPAEVEETLSSYICQRHYIQNEQRTLGKGPPTIAKRNLIHN